MNENGSNSAFVLVLCVHRIFPWHDMAYFTSLEYFSMILTGIESIPANISWSSTLRSVHLTGNWHLKLIDEHAFSSASQLQELSLLGSGDHLVVKPNGFHTTSKKNPKVLDISSFYSGKVDDLLLEENAFGNVDGGELWEVMNIATSDFPEDAFRLLLKAHFDKGHTSNNSEAVSYKHK